MRTLILIALPVALLALWALARALAGRPAHRRTLNVLSALALLVYFTATAGLGLFWVANQELPVFDLHYLFGYCTLALVAIHLAFNWRVVTAWLRGPARPPTAAPAARRVLARALGWVLFGALAFYLGYRQGRSRMEVAPVPAPASAPGAPSAPSAPPPPAEAVAAPGDTAGVLEYHRRTSHSLIRHLFAAPSIAWGARPAPVFPGGARVALPVPRDSAGMSLGAALASADAPVRAPDLAALSDLLHHAGGVTRRGPGYRRHAAASSGALYPVEIHLWARAIPGLAAGRYRYDPETHALLAAGGDGSGAQLADATGRPALAGAPAAVILSIVPRRTAIKYGDRAFRYALADAGHSALNLAAGARALGIGGVLVGRFDDGGLNHWLGLDGVEEFALLVAPLGAASGATPEAGWRYPPRPSAPPATGAVGMVHALTALERVGSARLPDAGPAPFSHATAPELPVDLFTLIRRRRSVRRFSDGPVPLELLTALRLASTAHPALESGGALEVRWVVHGDGPLAPGVYAFDPGAQRPHLVASGRFARASRHAALDQAVAGDAALYAVIAADHERLFAAGGARGYRDALLEAGLAGEALYLAAGSLGLGACGVGAFYEPEINTLARFDPSRYLVLHTVAIGVSRE